MEPRRTPLRLAAQRPRMGMRTFRNLLAFIVVLVYIILQQKWMRELAHSPSMSSKESKQGWMPHDDQEPVGAALRSQRDPHEHGSDVIANSNPAKGRPRIALLASFVPQAIEGGGYTKVTEFDNTINKACYAYMWGYDFIFNTTSAFSDEDRAQAPWLSFGSWNRVPHLKSQLSNYDWIFYGDLDHVIRDLSRPLEAFLKDFELYKQNPSIIAPADIRPKVLFSTFTFMVKNSEFGHRTLDNWMKFGRGVCPKGNFPMESMADGKPKYDWHHSDQPGLWYALVQTYEQTYKTKTLKPVCDPDAGYVAGKYAYGQAALRYFRNLGIVKGHHGDALVQMKDQPIIFCTDVQESSAHGRGGLGLQLDQTGGKYDHLRKHAFAYHEKNITDPDFYREVDLCKTVHGCYARYNDQGKLEVGCNDREFTVVQ